MFRRAILEAAAAVFAENGFHAARIQDIAERARIGVGTVYNHFEQKEDVLVALLEEHTAALTDRFTAPDSGDFAARLEAKVERVLRYQDEHRAFFALAMDYGLLGPPTSASSLVLKGRKSRHFEGMRKGLVSFFEEGVKEGALAPGHDPLRLVRIFGGMLRAFTTESLIDGKGDSASRAGEIVELFLHGAEAR